MCGADVADFNPLPVQHFYHQPDKEKISSLDAVELASFFFFLCVFCFNKPAVNDRGVLFGKTESLQ